jgi:hypothetical protein
MISSKLGKYLGNNLGQPKYSDLSFSGAVKGLGTGAVFCNHSDIRWLGRRFISIRVVKFGNHSPAPRRVKSLSQPQIDFSGLIQPLLLSIAMRNAQAGHFDSPAAIFQFGAMAFIIPGVS